MQVRCRNCGAVSSLDALIEDDKASEVVLMLAEIGNLVKPVIKYLGLFRSEKRVLTWSRTATLLAELKPLIQQQRIERNHQVHEAPAHAWESAIDKVLQARDAGKLQTPLKSHGYLFEIIAAESAKAYLQGVQGIVDAPLLNKPKPISAMAKSFAALDD